jgi:hypothetical protein
MVLHDTFDLHVPNDQESWFFSFLFFLAFVLFHLKSVSSVHFSVIDWAVILVFNCLSF